jgi:hypothetical protein
MSPPTFTPSSLLAVSRLLRRSGTRTGNSRRSTIARVAPASPSVPGVEAQRIRPERICLLRESTFAPKLPYSRAKPTDRNTMGPLGLRDA